METNSLKTSSLMLAVALAGIVATLIGILTGTLLWTWSWSSIGISLVATVLTILMIQLDKAMPSAGWNDGHFPPPPKPWTQELPGLLFFWFMIWLMVWTVLSSGLDQISAALK